MPGARAVKSTARVSHFLRASETREPRTSRRISLNFEKHLSVVQVVIEFGKVLVGSASVPDDASRPVTAFKLGVARSQRVDVHGCAAEAKKKASVFGTPTSTWIRRTRWHQRAAPR